jgi:hypothetical protein
MAAYTVTHKQLLSNYAVLQTLTPNDLVVGRTFTVGSIAAPFAGTFVCYDKPEYLFIGVDNEGDLLFNYEIPVPNQVLYACTGTDVQRTASSGTITFTETCTWITATQIEDWLGIGTASSLDAAFLTQCALAANSLAFTRRQEAGYRDNLSTSPNGQVTLGTISLGGFFYRQRGAVTDFATFDGMSAGASVGLSPAIKMLLGIPKPAVA